MLMEWAFEAFFLCLKWVITGNNMAVLRKSGCRLKDLFEKGEVFITFQRLVSEDFLNFSKTDCISENFGVFYIIFL